MRGSEKGVAVLALMVLPVLPIDKASALSWRLCGSLDRTNCVEDGDTFWTDTRVRIAGIDAPELPGPASCSQEAMLGKKAASRLAELLSGGAIHLDVHSRAFGRLLADVRVSGMDVGRQLIAEDLALQGRGRSWCEATARPPVPSDTNPIR